MGVQMEIAKHRLFDASAVAASDVKLFPGSNRDATPEQLAEEVAGIVARLETGDYEIVDEDCD